MELLSRRQLQGLKEYKYKAGGYTVLDDLHNPVWNWLVDRLPLWLAPNLITLAASMCILLAYVLNIIYLPDFTGEAPAWVYVLTALSVVAYVNLDCMDGKQARRTGSSSPLGQLFDHGLDALVLHMMLGNIASSLGVPCGLKMAAGCMGILAPWLLAQWEEYHTGVMMYGTRYYGVMEANYSICLVHLISALAGPGVWRLAVPLPPPLAPWLGTHASLADLSLVAVPAAGVFQGLHNIQRVLFTGSSALLLQKEEAGDKQLGRGAALRQLAGLLVVLVLGTSLLHNTHGHGALNARLSFLTFGLMYALTASQLIVAHMCKGQFAFPELPTAILSLGIAAQYNSDGDSQALLAAAAVAALALGVYLTYTLSVVRQISTFLGIKVLTIPVKTQQQRQQEVAQQQASQAEKEQQALLHKELAAAEQLPASPKSPVTSETATSDEELTDATSVIPSANVKGSEGPASLVKRR